MPSIPLINPFTGTTLHETPTGLADEAGREFPLKEGAYRFVELESNYTDNFGFQWNKFTESQIDKLSKFSLSRDRFFAQTGWDKEDLSGKDILEVGSGAGRFTQVVLDHTNANLYSVDYSNAVEANYRNNGPNPRLHLFQASIYDMPFKPGSFDKVFCFGVLQHTPDVERSVKTLISMLKPGGELVVDFYPIHGWWTKVHSKYIFRPITRKMSHKRLFNLIDRNANRLIKTYRFFSRLGVGPVMNRFVPICDIEGTFPKGLSEKKIRELVVLDTFDMFSPAYDQPQRIETVVHWFNQNGMTNVWGGTIRLDNLKAAVVKGFRKS